MDPEEQTCLLHALFMYASWLPCGGNKDGKTEVPRYFQTKLSSPVAFCDRLSDSCVVYESTMQLIRNQVVTSWRSFPRVASLLSVLSSMQ